MDKENISFPILNLIELIKKVHINQKICYNCKNYSLETIIDNETGFIYVKCVICKITTII